PHGLRRADARGDLRIRRRGAGGDLAQRLPHALLERGAAHVQRQVEAERGRLDEADHLRDQPLEVAVTADQPRLGKSVLELTRQRVRIVAEQDRADAALGGGHEDEDRKSTRLNSSHGSISYAVFCLKKKKKETRQRATTS